MRSTRITRWYDGRFRARNSWEPELRNILAEDVDRRGISWEEKVEDLEAEGVRDWGDDLAVVLEVCCSIVEESEESE